MSAKKTINDGFGVRQSRPSSSGGVGAGVGPRQPAPRPSAPKPGK